mmetsp:Transcript_159574/g.488318  ORF Transcript_159574/g.488318 Transcript_159574/m.488318 type:complete len:275 (-) Transcript_159574:50-874(-)
MPAAPRTGSRSPRRGAAAEPEAWEDVRPESAPWELMPEQCEERFMGQLRLQSSYLEQFLRPPAPVSDSAASRGPPELAAGLPLEAARALVFLGPQPAGPPWQGLPAPLACVAAALRLFSRLMPGRIPDDACEGLCARLAAAAAAGEVAATEAALVEAAASGGLAAEPVAEPRECLEAMVRGRPSACCALLEGYVGVLEDAETGEELEKEVGSHCVLIVGGDLSGPSYVVFDPWGLNGGEAAYWSAHDTKAAAPAAWIQLSPAAPAAASAGAMQE